MHTYINTNTCYTSYNVGCLDVSFYLYFKSYIIRGGQFGNLVCGGPENYWKAPDSVNLGELTSSRLLCSIHIEICMHTLDK